MTTQYSETFADFTKASKRIYNYCTYIDKPMRIMAYRNKDEGTGGIMYSYRQHEPPYENLHSLRTMFEIGQEIFDMSVNIQQRLLDTGYLVNGDDCKGMTHKLTFQFSEYKSDYFGIMSDEEAVIQGFRHGAVAITRINR